MVEKAGFTVTEVDFGDVKYGKDLVVVVGKR